MKTKTNAIVRLKFSSEKQVNAVLNALKPEADAPLTRRSKVNLKRQDLFVILNFEAEDVVALRAALNSYLRWIDSTVNVLHSMENV